MGRRILRAQGTSARTIVMLVIAVVVAVLARRQMTGSPAG